MDIDLSNYIQSFSTQSRSIPNLPENQLMTPSDPLLSSVTKRSQDQIKFTYFFLKQKLSEGLEERLQNLESKHPSMKGQYYVGVIKGQIPKVEVIPIQEAIEAVKDIPKDEAEKTMKASPLGYFSSQDFTMHTPQTASYQEFQSGLQEYFEESKDIINYLQNNPETQVTLEELY